MHKNTLHIYDEKDVKRILRIESLITLMHKLKSLYY